mmetsp:Transcript_36381/g.32651  ORF Transcript_36381/g.32651 Transcript_36381/m.32651 type:complete len:222 (-) Transcript_36381:179-844(-)
MKTAIITLFALLALQASATWVILEIYENNGCTGDIQSTRAFEEGECYSTGGVAIQYDEGAYISYNVANCDGTTATEIDVSDICEDTGDTSAIIVASGLSTPVNADYPLTQATFSSDDCDHLEMITYYTTTSVDDMEDAGDGCEDIELLGISVKTEFTSSGQKSTIYAEEGCTGITSTSAEITFGECEETTGGYTILYYDSGSMILASITALITFIGLALMG